MPLVKRSDKKAFYGIKQKEGASVFTRMRNFTELSASKNPKEYTRRYVDEDFEKTDVTGYSVSYSYAFDDYTDDAVLSDIKNILDNELIGRLFIYFVSTGVSITNLFGKNLSAISILPS